MNLDEWLNIEPQNKLSDDAKILFICVGNINRSPACEIILKQMIKTTDLSWEITSAALSPKNEGKLTTKKMRDMLEEFGYEYNEIRSKPVTQDMIDNADVIFIMDRANEKKIIEQFGIEVKKKVRFVGELNPRIDSIYIPDPHFAQGVEEHRKVVKIIESNLHRLVDQHRKNNENIHSNV